MTKTDTKPDFEALRAERNAAINVMIDEAAKSMGWDGPVHSSFDPNACYCACASGGPCEHDFNGWREFDDGRGGETVCQRCGLGAMGHSLSIGM